MDLTPSLTNWNTLLTVFIATISIYILLIVLARIFGLRSFSKMSGFDFVVTIALGSMVANTILTKNPPLLIAVVSFVTLFTLQMITAKFRYKPAKISKHIDNSPLLLMKGSEILEENMEQASVSHGELYSKLRKEGVTKLSHVKAAVLETTGDVSVLVHTDPTHQMDTVLLSGVQE